LETRFLQCRTCGAEIDPATNKCPDCGPAEAGLAVPARSAAEVTGQERAFGLLLFEAEECLARGATEKAAVLASRAVKERPDSITARALLDRARRGLLKGRRKEKLEARVKEAQALFEAGDLESAGRIVTSALKVVPDHPVALALFANLKQLRLAAGTAEAQAERELDRLTKAQAKRSLEAARRALAAGWDRKALLTLRRGLRSAPDDPELLGLLRELQAVAEGDDATRARRRAANAQIRAGLDLLARGDLEESLKILRAVLLDDPDNERAQAAVHEVRRERQKRAPVPIEPVTLAAPAAHASAPRGSPTPARPPAPAAFRPIATSRPPIARPAPGSAAPAPAAIDRPRVPVEILLPRTRRRATPAVLILGGALLLFASVFLLVSLGGHAPAPRPSPAAAEAPAEAPPPPKPSEPGPLDALEPALRAAVEAVLADYGRALETADAALLGRARPDLSAEARAERLAPFRGALNAATDLRVVDVTQRGSLIHVAVLRTDVIVGGHATGPTAPVEEVLRFERRGAQWRLR